MLQKAQQFFNVFLIFNIINYYLKLKNLFECSPITELIYLYTRIHY